MKDGESLDLSVMALTALREIYDDLPYMRPENDCRSGQYSCNFKKLNVTALKKSTMIPHVKIKNR